MTRFSYDAKGNQIVSSEGLDLTPDGKITADERTEVRSPGEWYGDTGAGTEQ